MSRFERDLIKRQIEQLGEAVAAILLRARAEHDYESGLEAVRLRAQEGLGVDYAMLSRLAPASAAMLLRDGEVIQTTPGSAPGRRPSSRPQGARPRRRHSAGERSSSSSKRHSGIGRSRPSAVAKSRTSACRRNARDSLPRMAPGSTWHPNGRLRAFLPSAGTEEGPRFLQSRSPLGRLACNIHLR